MRLGLPVERVVGIESSPVYDLVVHGNRIVNLVRGERGDRGTFARVNIDGFEVFAFRRYHHGDDIVFPVV